MDKMVKFTALCVLLSFSFLFPHIQLLNQKSIDKKAAAIQTMITRERYALAALTVMGIAQNIICLRPMYDWIMGKSTDIAGLSLENVQAQQIVPPSFLSKDWFIKCGDDITHLFFTQDGWASIAKTSFSFGGQMSILFIMQKIAHDLQHPDTITWYASVKVPYKKTVHVMKELVQKMRTRSLSAQRSEFYHLSLQTSCKQLSCCGENICAYMQYKSNSSALSPDQQYMAQASSRYLFNYHNKWLREVSALLEVESPLYYKIEQLITAYELELVHQIKLFSSLESEIAL